LQTAGHLSRRRAPAIDGRLSAAYDFELPDELIAHAPASRRDASRLLVLAGDEIAHRTFADVGDYLHAGDVLVLNETRVIAARLAGTRSRSGGSAEIFLLHPADALRYRPEATRWIALARPARRIQAGERIDFATFGHATVVRALEGGMREIELTLRLPFEDFLERAGTIPLPPYVRNETAAARLRYQTVFARVPGSVAAPTAALHFTPELLESLARRGVELVHISLQIGLGTFRPISTERIDEHVMHAEAFTIPARAGAALERARSQRRRVVAAGTTVVRALEQVLLTYGRIVAGEHVATLFITPGFEFRAVDAMITNFHLPRSSLLVLVSAFAGRERILAAYEQAVERRYRFFSFGDAMFVTNALASSR
jgi:S-adenosylmethionine:tRNA ribosyltransferase-isomerase